MRRVSLIGVIGAIILLALVAIPVAGQTPTPLPVIPDLTPVEGKFKVIFRNCLGSEIRVDLKGEGLDFFADKIENHSADRQDCPYRVTVVRPAINEKAPVEDYRGTATTQQHGDTYSVTYETKPEPNGVVVISFYKPGAVDINYVAGHGVPTPTSAITATVTSAAQPTAGMTPQLPVSGMEGPPFGGYRISTGEMLWALVLIGGLLLLVSRLALKHKS